MCRPHRRFAPLLPRTLRRIPQAVGTVATQVSFHTYGFHKLFQYRKRQALLQLSSSYTGGRFSTPSVSIPQAVGTVATIKVGGKTVFSTESFNTASGRHCCNMKKQVSAIFANIRASFNTASGRHCCNNLQNYDDKRFCRKQFQYRKRQALLQQFVIFHRAQFHKLVSIPQAVGTVATFRMQNLTMMSTTSSFNTASGRHCCNYTRSNGRKRNLRSFNTASGRHCCNFIKTRALR